MGPFIVAGDILLNTSDLKIHESSFHLDIADCAWLKNHFQIPLEGSLSVNASISGLVTHPVIDLKLTGEHLKIHQAPIEKFSGEGSLSKSMNGLDGHAYFNFLYRDVRFKADSIFRWNEKEMSLTAIEADYGSAQIKGALRYILDKEIFDGALEACVRSLGHSNAF